MKIYYTSNDIPKEIFDSIEKSLKEKNDKFKLPLFNNFIPDNIQMRSDCMFARRSEPSADDYFNAYLYKDTSYIPEVPEDV